jgi:hypothetical protein
MLLDNVINATEHPIEDERFRLLSKQQLDEQGVLVLTDFLSAQAIEKIVKEGVKKQPEAFYSVSGHNVYLRDHDPTYPAMHPRNFEVSSSKGCITDDQIASDSPLRALYDSDAFRAFLAFVLGEQKLYNYADPLSSINLHYADQGQELGWHFDESSFAITLLLQSPEAGGCFEYIKNMRDADRGEMNYSGVSQVLCGERESKTLAAQAGTLVMFRGRNAIHRVTPVQGETTRMLVVLAYNSKPGIKLSESARMTFYGRL